MGLKSLAKFVEVRHYIEDENGNSCVFLGTVSAGNIINAQFRATSESYYQFTAGTAYSCQFKITCADMPERPDIKALKLMFHDVADDWNESGILSKDMFILVDNGIDKFGDKMQRFISW